MKRGPIRSIVEDTWGTGTVYSYDEFTSGMGLERMDHSKTTELTLDSGTRLAHRLISHQTLSNLLFGLDTDAHGNKPTEGLPFFVSSLYSTVLEDLLIQLQCLEQCNYHLKIIKVLADENHLKRLKYNVKTPAVGEDELEGIDRSNLNDIIYKIRKLGADRYRLHSLLDTPKNVSCCETKKEEIRLNNSKRTGNLVITVVQKMYLELAEHHTFYSLRDHIQLSYDRHNHRIGLEVEEARNKQIRRDLSKQLRQQRNQIKSAIYDCDVVIQNLKSQIEDSALYSETRSRFLGNWQVARAEQHQQTILNTENEPLSSIIYYKQRSEHEVRVHTEVEVLVNIVINETIVKVEEWMDKYDKDIENMDLKIQLRKIDYQDQREKRKELTHTLETHEELMKSWIHFKEEREKARLYHEKMTNAALVVQAWWRGLIVRYQLGPFKPKKPPKHKKK